VALDSLKELEDMDRKMNDEKAAAMEELNGLIDAEELGPTPEIADRITEVRDKVNRIEASWKLKRNLRVKEEETGGGDEQNSSCTRRRRQQRRRRGRPRRGNILRRRR
jgi:hypothetical protein